MQYRLSEGNGECYYYLGPFLLQIFPVKILPWQSVTAQSEIEICNPTAHDKRRQGLSSQLACNAKIEALLSDSRSAELGFGEGVEDDGYPRGLTPQELDTSYLTLKAMAVAVNATIQPVREMPACRGRVYVVFKISRVCRNHLSYTDLRIAGRPS